MFSPFKGRQKWLLIPFAYTLETRLKSRRDFAYNIAMAWLPGVALLILCGGYSPPSAAAKFAVGYLAFISIYELGYLGNDLWDAQRDPGGRKRIDFVVTTGWVATFVAIRLACFAVIGAGTGWWANLYWSAGFVSLALAFTLHNIVSRNARLLTFPVLATLRFLLPILGALRPEAAAVALVVAALPYLLPRWLAYAEGKGIMSEKVRQAPAFRSLFLIAIAPIVALASFALESWVPIALHGYYFLVTLVGERAALKKR